MERTKSWLVINSASGSYDADRIDALRRALAEAGFAPERIIDVQGETLPDAMTLSAAGAGLLVVFAGDGTINGVLGGVAGWDGGVLVLPGGTANLLAHALHGERSAEEIVATLPALHRVRRNAVRSDHGTAHIELLAGPGARWSDVREAMREGDLGEIVSGGIEAAQKSMSGPGVTIVEPATGDPRGYAGVRMTPCGGGIKVDGYGAGSFSDLLRQGMALIRRDYREGPHEHLGMLDKLVCRSLDGTPIELMVDGERRTGTVEERFSLVELPVDLLAAQP